MLPRRRLLLVVAIVLVGIVFAVRRPWEHMGNGPDGGQSPYTITSTDFDLLNPANNVTLRFVVSGDDDCTVTVTGGHGGNIERSNFRVKGTEERTRTLKARGPFIINSVTVNRDGQTHKKDLNVTVPPGQTREVRIKPDGSVEIVPQL